MHHPSNAYGQGRLTLFCLYLALYNGTAQQAGLHAVPFPLATKGLAHVPLCILCMLSPFLLTLQPLSFWPNVAFLYVQ